MRKTTRRNFLKTVEEAVHIISEKHPEFSIDNIRKPNEEIKDTVFFSFYKEGQYFQSGIHDEIDNCLDLLNVEEKTVEEIKSGDRIEHITISGKYKWLDVELKMTNRDDNPIYYVLTFTGDIAKSGKTYKSYSNVLIDTIFYSEKANKTLGSGFFQVVRRIHNIVYLKQLKTDNEIQTLPLKNEFLSEDFYCISLDGDDRIHKYHKSYYTSNTEFYEAEVWNG